MSPETALRRAAAYAEYAVMDDAFIRLAFRNAHPVGPELYRSNHPWPHQLRGWRERGVRTVINLRGPGAGPGYPLERDACDRLGLALVDFPVRSRAVPSRATLLAAQRMFDEVAYPVLMHCKSGADRAGMMSVLYLNFRRGVPIEAALAQLSLRYLHLPAGRTGMPTHLFRTYLREAASAGTSFLDWVKSSAFDPARIEAAFRPRGLGVIATEFLLRRE